MLQGILRSVDTIKCALISTIPLGCFNKTNSPGCIHPSPASFTLLSIPTNFDIFQPVSMCHVKPTVVRSIAESSRPRIRSRYSETLCTTLGIRRVGLSPHLVSILGSVRTRRWENWSSRRINTISWTISKGWESRDDEREKMRQELQCCLQYSSSENAKFSHERINERTEWKVKTWCSGNSFLNDAVQG